MSRRVVAYLLLVVGLGTACWVILELTDTAQAQQQTQAPSRAAAAVPVELEWIDLVPLAERGRETLRAPAPLPFFIGEDTEPFMEQEGSATVNEELEGKLVKLPGFVVPLSIDSNQNVSDFLFVPYFGACMHKPPPPPNQIVYVRMRKPLQLESLYRPLWVTGHISTKSKATGLAAAAYTLDATGADVYEE